MNNKGLENKEKKIDSKDLDSSLFEFQGVNDFENEDIQGQDLTFWKDAFLRFKKNKASVVATFVLSFIIILAIISPFIGAYHNKVENYECGTEANLIGQYMVPDNDLVPPMGTVKSSSEYAESRVCENNGEEVEYAPINSRFIFGTDDQGRDLFVRTMVGALISIAFGITAAFIDLLLGVTLGAISGYYGGKVDLFLQRIVEILGAIPTLIWVILLIIAMDPGILPLIIAITISGWIPMYRIVRAQMLKIKNQEYVLGAQTIGQSNIKIIFKHILPNTMGVIIIWIMFTIPSAIFFESFLSFLGLGINAPIPSLGKLASDGKEFLASYPYILFVPTLVLSSIMLCFNLIADGLRDALDPKMRGGK